MQNKLQILLVGIGMVALTAACTAEKKQMKNYALKGTVDQKDSAVTYYFENEDYQRASFILEEIMPRFRGQPHYEELMYLYAESKFKTKDYLVASHYYEQYTSLFPSNERAEECAFKHAYCFYLLSAPWYLDQSNTLKAIDKFQYFLVTYPASEKVKEADEIIVSLREQLARKSFEQASLYFKREMYKASVTAFENSMLEFPDSKYQEESNFMLFKSRVFLADNSTERRKRNRYLDAIDSYQKFVDKYPKSEFIKEAETLFVKTKKNLAKYSEV